MNKKMPKKNRQTVFLVPGNGGVRGLAHIGVIHWLEESDYKCIRYGKYYEGKNE